MLAWAAFPVAPKAETTIFVNQHYEVRDHDAPVKYVFNGGTRVARITGSLVPNMRLQRLRLTAGWNLCSVAVGGIPLPWRLAGESSNLVTAAHKWIPATKTWMPLALDEALVAGTVLWLRSRTNAVLGVEGYCPDPVSQTVDAGGSFHASAGLTPLPLGVGQTGDASRSWAGFDALEQGWWLQRPSISVSDFASPDFIAPGQAVFIHTDTPVKLEAPDRAARIAYYHQDHLGSSSVVADSRGELMEETAFYPHGIPRHEHHLREIEEAYTFSQKEQDRESGLHYFEARYLSGGLARFVSIDPKYADPTTLSGGDLAGFLGTPQKLNLYAYAASNPLKYWDPTGLDEEKSPGLVDTVDTMGDRLGFLSDINKLDGPGMLFDVVGVTIKTAKAIDNPTAPRIIVAGYEVTKAAATKFVPPLGLGLQGLDLAGIGPGTFFDWAADSYDEMEARSRENEKTIADLKHISKTYEEIAEINRRMTQSLKAETARLQEQIKKKDAQYKEDEALIKRMDERIRRSDEVLKKFRARNARR